MTAEAEYIDWLNSRPPHIRRIVELMPPGSYTFVYNRKAWVLSYCETASDKVMIRVSYINPADDYDGAFAAEPIYICADHIEAARTE